MISYSVKLKGNTNRIAKNGLVALYLLVIINRKSKYISLDLHWPAQFVDSKAGVIMPRKKKDNDYNDYMLIINNEVQKVNEIFKLYRIQDKALDIETFNYEINHVDRKHDFLVFMEEKLKERYKYNVIGQRTFTAGLGTIKKIKQYRKGGLPFYGLTKAFFEGFANHLKIKGNEQGTIWTRVKDIKTYIHMAEEEGFSIPPDHRKYKIAAGASSLVYLEEEELRSLVNLYNSKRLLDCDQDVLRAFLFSCFTSLRISDVQRANWGWVSIDKVMKFVPWKGRRFHREIAVPLNTMALKFIQHSRGNFFTLPTDQEINRTLKDIAVEAKIFKRLTFHVSRHTYGTHYYKHNKDTATLQAIMGHSKIQTTMVYVHINDTEKRAGVDRMSDFFEKTPAYQRVIRENLDRKPLTN